MKTAKTKSQKTAKRNETAACLSAGSICDFATTLCAYVVLAKVSS